MIDDLATINAIDQYLERNSNFWAKFEPPKELRSNQTILVDMMVGHPGYMIGNCIIAKYMQKRYNSKVVAVILSPQHSFNIEVAHSFNVDSICYLDQGLKVDVNIDVSVLTNAKDISTFRKLIIDFNYQGVPLGDLVYDSFLRTTGKGTVDNMEDGILDRMADAVKKFVFFDKLIQQENVIATVQGHIVYNQYGTMARAALKNGATVYSRKASAGPLTIRRYTEMSECCEYEFRFTEEEFDEVYKNHKDFCIQKGKEFIEKRFKGDRGPEYIDAFGDHKISFQNEELLDHLGLDPAKPSIVIMSHIMPDAPHAFGEGLYNDYYEWLEGTLEIIKDFDQFNWIIKEHPELKRYNPKHTATELTKQYQSGRNHIAIANEDINTLSLFSVVNAVVTVAGTAALEFPTQGIPVLVAGKSAFSGFGFTVEPKTREEYANYLYEIGNWPRLSQEKIDRALAYVYMFFLLCRVTCCYLPKMSNTFWDEMNYEKIFTDAREALDKYKVL